MESGWIKLHRQLKDWQHYQEPSVLLVFVDILLSANTKDGWHKGERLRRGEIFTSVSTIAESTGLDPKTVRKALDKLVATGEVSVVATNKGTKIHVNQFSKFQSSGIIPQPIPQQNPQQSPQPIPQQNPQPIINENIRREEGKNVSPSSVEEGLSGCAAPPTPQEAVDYEKLVLFFNETTQGVFGRLRHPIGEGRKKNIRARVAQFGKKALEEVIKKAAASDFLKGQNPRGFVATFDWLILPKNFEKTLSGNYDNREGQPRSSSGRDLIGTNFINKD